MAEFYGCRHLA